jgi:hypothetical protein
VRSKFQDPTRTSDSAYRECGAPSSYEASKSCDEIARIPAKRNSTSRSFQRSEPSTAFDSTSMIRRISLFTLLLALFVFPALLYPQALTPPKGEGYVSLTFEDMFVKNHFLSSGARLDIGHIRTIGLVESIEYGITDRLGASLSLPVIASKYYGKDPHQLPIDDGNYHGGTQDFRLGVQYNVRRRPVVLTPFVTVIVPSRDYIFYAHSAVGTHQPELDLGLAAAGRFERWLPNAYYQAAYSYGIVGVVTGVRPNRSHMSLEGGYFVTRYLTLRVMADSQLTQGGLNIPQDFQINDFPNVADERWRHHDQSANINSLNLGGGFDVALGRRWNVFAGLTTSVWGENGHAMRTGLSAGVSWSFRTPWAKPTEADKALPVTSTTHTH